MEANSGVFQQWRDLLCIGSSCTPNLVSRSYGLASLLTLVLWKDSDGMHLLLAAHASLAYVLAVQ